MWYIVTYEIRNGQYYKKENEIPTVVLEEKLYVNIKCAYIQNIYIEDRSFVIINM